MQQQLLRPGKMENICLYWSEFSARRHLKRSKT